MEHDKKSQQCLINTLNVGVWTPDSDSDLLI